MSSKPPMACFLRYWHKKMFIFGERTSGVALCRQTAPPGMFIVSSTVEACRRTHKIKQPPVAFMRPGWIGIFVYFTCLQLDVFAAKGRRPVTIPFARRQSDRLDVP